MRDLLGARDYLEGFRERVQVRWFGDGLGAVISTQKASALSLRTCKVKLNRGNAMQLASHEA